MRRGSAAIRLLAGLALALALTAAVAPFAGSRAVAQDNGLASITLYTAICPPGFAGDDYYDECYGTPGANIEYFLSGPAFADTVVAETGANGFTAFENIDVAGEYALQIQVPGDFVSVAAFCSEGGASFPFEYDEVFGTILLDLTTSDDLRCDFYITPDDQGAGSADLTIHNRVCPPGYEGTDFYNVCHDAPVSGQVFYLDSTDGPHGTTDAAGNVTFAELAPDTYFVFGGPPGDFIADTAVFCAPTASPGTPFPFDQDAGEAGFTIALAGGDDVTCDVYSVPVDQGPAETATLTIYKATCPAGYDDDDYFADCFDNATKDVTFYVTPLGGGTTVQDTTDANGFAGFSLAPGGYVVEESVPGEFAEFFAYCTAGGRRIDVGYSADGSRLTLDVLAGQTVRCDWYNLPFDLRGETPTPTPKPQPTARPTQPVTTLPSTGAGGMETSGGLAGFLAVALLATAGGAISLGRRRSGRARA